MKDAPIQTANTMDPPLTCEISPAYPGAVIFSGPLPIAMRDFCLIFLGVTIWCLIAKIDRPHCPFNRSTAQ